MLNVNMDDKISSGNNHLKHISNLIGFLNVACYVIVGLAHFINIEWLAWISLPLLLYGLFLFFKNFSQLKNNPATRLSTVFIAPFFYIFFIVYAGFVLF